MIQLAYLLGADIDVEGRRTPLAPLRIERMEAGWRLSGVWPHRDLRAARRQVDAYFAGLEVELEVRCLFTGRTRTVGQWRTWFAEPVTVANAFEGRHALVEGKLFARLFGLYQLGESDVVLVADSDTEVSDVYEVLSAWAAYRLRSGDEPKWDRPFPFGFGLLSFAEHEVGDAEFWSLLRESLGSHHLKGAFDERMEAPAPRVFIEAEDASDPDTGYAIGVAATLAIRKGQREAVKRLVDFYEDGGGWLIALDAAAHSSPNAQDAAGACERVADRRPGTGAEYFAYREEPKNALDSGWRFGCLDPEHVHDDKTLRILPLGQVARVASGIVDYLGLPPGWTVTFEERRFWTMPPGESRSFPDTRDDVGGDVGGDVQGEAESGDGVPS